MSKEKLEHSHGVTSDVEQDRIREIIYLIRKIIQANEIYTKELNKKFQVSAPQLQSLLTLYENGPLPLSHIAKLIMVKSSTVTGIIDRLEQKGFVSRVRDSKDRRVINIELTEEGKHLVENTPPPFQQKIVNGLKKFPEDEKKQIITALTKLTNLLDIHELEVD